MTNDQRNQIDQMNGPKDLNSMLYALCPMPFIDWKGDCGCAI